MGAIIGLFVPLVGQKFAKAAAFASLAILILLLLWGGKCAYDHSVISNYQSKVEASQAKADRKADQAAAAKAAADKDRRDYEADQLTEAIQNAPHDPKVPDRVERDRAFHKCLSLQQRARDNGLQPPRCV